MQSAILKKLVPGVALVCRPQIYCVCEGILREELQAERNCLVSGNWEKDSRSFLMVRNELTFIGRVILCGT